MEATLAATAQATASPTAAPAAPARAAERTRIDLAEIDRYLESLGGK